MRNSWEEKVFSDLDVNKSKTTRLEYETEKIPYVMEYLPDFILCFGGGHKRYIEAKGWLRTEDKAKMRKVKRQNPNIDLRIIFQSNNKKYIRWAEVNKIPWAVGVVPKEWFKLNG